MRRTQKSTSFLMYTLNIHNAYLWNGLLGTYAGNYDYTGDDSWGKYLSLLYDPTKVNDLQLTALRSSKQLVYEYTPEEGGIMFVMKIPPKYKKDVIEPFLKGEYSKIDKEYVNAHFKSSTINGSYSTNWLILNKDKSLRKFWEDQIGLPLPPDAEVWSRPRKEDEIYNYESFLVKENLDDI